MIDEFARPVPPVPNIPKTICQRLFRKEPKEINLYTLLRVKCLRAIPKNFPLRTSSNLDENDFTRLLVDIDETVIVLFWDTKQSPRYCISS